MLIRKRFVTNSSTSSYLIYGAKVTDSEINKLLEFVLKTSPPEKIKAAAEAYGREGEDLTSLENWEAVIEDLDPYDTEELMSILLPGFKLRTTREWGDADYYLCIDKSFRTDTDGLRVFFTDITAEDYKRLQSIIAEIGLKNQSIGFEHWAVSDY